ncbi:hypothetical protein [Kribbella italica]|uniref:Uncharacterized protein n=1 Tax=Kribbella italica TaxID=1540520 RepID=A0A7W9JDW5_9ACTN|nr:hypothetical protein [Kribbella italica]MBB5839997.1 hypothetical protein [Kribbella italica]
MGARVAARGLVVLFALTAGAALALVAGIDLGERSSVLRILVLLIAALQVAETAWQFVWAAEDGEPLAPYLPALAVAAGVPMSVAAHVDHVGLAVGIGGFLSALLSTAVLIKGTGRQAVTS